MYAAERDNILTQALKKGYCNFVQPKFIFNKKKKFMLPYATSCYLSTSCLGTFKFFQRLKMTLYFSLSVLSDNFFKTTRITTAAPVSLSSPIMRSSVSPSFTCKQKEKMRDYKQSLGKTNAHNLPFFPLNILISQERRKAANTRPIIDPAAMNF